jgi:ABC-type lipoprotein export system ATPase subunit
MIGFAGATFSWSLDTDMEGAVTPSKRAFRLNIQNELIFKRGCINMIVGPTGSGKTSILLALLGMIQSSCISHCSWTVER